MAPSLTGSSLIPHPPTEGSAPFHSMSKGQQRYLPVTPVMAVPAMMTPAPVTVTPTPMAMVVPAPVMAMSPPHLLRLEPFDLLTRCHGRMGILTRFIFN